MGISPAAATLVERLVAATRAERRARQELRDARTAQAQVLRDLRQAGVPASLIALRVSRALGETLTLDERRRRAGALRQRRSRAQRRGVTPGHANDPASHGQLPSAAPLSDRALPPAEKESNMAKLVKRTITEEFVEHVDDEAEGLDDLEAANDGDDDEPDEEEDARPAKRARRR